MSAAVLVQLSDLHIGPPGARPYGTDTAGNFVAVAARLAEMELAPAAVLLTGDLSDKGEVESYELLRALVDEHLVPLGAPVLAVVGNHDHRGSFLRGYLGRADADDETPHYFSLDVGDDNGDPVRVVMCDSYLAGKVTGRLGPQQLDWLDSELTSAADRPVVIALHHPSVPRGVPRPDDYLLEDRDEFAAVVSSHRVAAILCGHSHVATAAQFAGTTHCAAPATAYLLDPSRRSGNRAFEGAGFTVCTLRDGRAVVNPVLLAMSGAVLYEH
ncbi:MAG: metallophosphoesterase [Acidimicrobiales bacterium]